MVKVSVVSWLHFDKTQQLTAMVKF
jgi:hypothetical protein